MNLHFNDNLFHIIPVFLILFETPEIQNSILNYSYTSFYS